MNVGASCGWAGDRGLRDSRRWDGLLVDMLHDDDWRETQRNLILDCHLLRLDASHIRSFLPSALNTDVSESRSTAHGEARKRGHRYLKDDALTCPLRVPRTRLYLKHFPLFSHTQTVLSVQCLAIIDLTTALSLLLILLTLHRTSLQGDREDLSNQKNKTDNDGPRKLSWCTGETGAGDQNRKALHGYR